MVDFVVAGEETSIVLVGAFNPAIFHPTWLSNNKLVSVEEAFPEGVDSPSIELIHKEFTRFQLALANIEVVQNRFIARTNDSSNSIRMRDLVLGIFTLLSHTPVKQVGINLIQNIEFEDEGLWDSIGHVFAPKDIWSKSMNGRLGMKELKIQSVERRDKLLGATNVKIWPTAIKKISVEINHHLELFNLQGEQILTTQQALESHWDSCMDESKNIIDISIREAIRHVRSI